MKSLLSALLVLVCINTNAADLEAQALRNRNLVSDYVNFENTNIGDMVPFFNGLYFTFIPSATNDSDYYIRTYQAISLPTENFSTIYDIPTITNSTTVLNVANSEISYTEWIEMRAQYYVDTTDLTFEEAIDFAGAEEELCFDGVNSCAGAILGTSTDASSTNGSSNASISSTTVETDAATAGNTTTTTTTTTTTNVESNTSTTTTTTTTTSQISEDHNFYNETHPEYNPECQGGCEEEEYLDGYIVDEQVETEVTTEGSTTDETEVETTVETSTETFVEAEKEWEFDFAPIIMIDFLKANKIVTISTGKDANKTTMFKRADFATKAPELMSSKWNDKFYMKKSSTVTGALGVAMTAQYINNGSLSNLTPVIGIAPIAGRTKTYEGFLDNKIDAKAFKGRKALKSATEVNSWSVGDKLRYDVNGGIMTTVGLGFSGLHMGIAHVALGTWSQTVEKLSDNIAKVTLENTALKSVTRSTGFSIVSVGLNKIKSDNVSNSFLFDIKDEEALSAMNSFLAGDFVPAERLAETDIRKVLKTEVSKTKLEAKMRTFTAGIPFVNFSSGKGQVFSKSLTSYLVDGTENDVVTSMYVKNKGSRVFNKLSNTAVTFAAIDYVTTKNKEKKTGTVGMFSYLYTKTKGKIKHIERKVNALIKMTGLTQELKVDLPDDKDKGYVEVMFNLNFDQTATDVLINKISTEEEALQKLGKLFVETYFKKGDANGICEANVENRLDTCKYFFAKATKKHISKMVKALKEMKSCAGDNRRLCITKSYAKFGKHFNENQFTFQTIFNLLKGRGMTGTYSVTGQEIRRHELMFDWKAFVDNK
ncbi:hypothetical protein A9Q84_16725 [Halobacteriovorax marinus]|uniref:Uncharacterized protein n=1 Tax=Halobacteriovorax marinus TaxID=97084 RepID=A0A1Y5F4J2_9BACT|nr:hypothetical protein A9Q84_16725 [Halobacteriovorax marinus]